MRYTEKELRAFTCPMNETTQEHCLKILKEVKEILHDLGYESRGSVQNAEPAAAAFSCLLEKAGKKLELGIRTSMATNTGCTSTSPVRLYLCAEDAKAALELEEMLAAHDAVSRDGAVYSFENGLRPCTFMLCFGKCWDLAETGMQVLATGAMLYPQLDIREFHKKNRATEYNFCRFCRVLVQLYYAVEPAVRQGICPVKLQQLVYNLPDVALLRFDSWQDRLTYILLELTGLVETRGLVLYESNGRNSVLADEAAQQRYLVFLEELRRWLA